MVGEENGWYFKERTRLQAEPRLKEGAGWSGVQFEEGGRVESLVFGEKSETAGFAEWKRGCRGSTFEKRNIVEGGWWGERLVVEGKRDLTSRAVVALVVVKGCLSSV